MPSVDWSKIHIGPWAIEDVGDDKINLVDATEHYIQMNFYITSGSKREKEATMELIRRAPEMLVVLQKIANHSPWDISLAALANEWAKAVLK